MSLRTALLRLLPDGRSVDILHGPGREQPHGGSRAAMCLAGVASWSPVFGGSVVYPRLGEDLPLCGDNLGLDSRQLAQPFLPEEASASPAEDTGAWGTFSVCVCSFNVLSLNSLTVEGTAADGLAFQPARPTLLADRLLAAGAQIAMLQETRTEAGVHRTQGYLRYASGALKSTVLKSGCRSILCSSLRDRGERPGYVWNRVPCLLRTRIRAALCSSIVKTVSVSSLSVFTLLIEPARRLTFRRSGLKLTIYCTHMVLLFPF